jgi:hypothetical protein
MAMAENHEQEFAALIDRIIKSKPLKEAPQQCELLGFLYKHRSEWLGAKQIEELHYGFGQLDSRHNPAHTRERIADLKGRLNEYAEQNPAESWRCDLPDAKRGEGYRLEFNPVEHKRTASQLFWKPHLEMPEDVMVVCGSHLFFFDPDRSAILRYYDFNVDKGREETLEALKAAHPEGYAERLEPWRDPYLSTGDVSAYEALLGWFHQQSGILIQRFISREVSDRAIHRSCPILVGRPQTNTFIGAIMASPEAAHLSYRMHALRGSVKIHDLRNDEREALSGFPVTEDGVIGPAPERGAVFGIVTRLRNPSGYGHVTIIAGDYYAMVIARIAEVTTTDKLAEDLLRQMKWPSNQDLPDSFEMLFSVALSPGNLKGEGHPKLLCWRAGPNTA